MPNMHYKFYTHLQLYENSYMQHIYIMVQIRLTIEGFHNRTHCTQLQQHNNNNRHLQKTKQNSIQQTYIVDIKEQFQCHNVFLSPHYTSKYTWYSPCTCVCPYEYIHVYIMYMYMYMYMYNVCKLYMYIHVHVHADKQHSPGASLEGVIQCELAGGPV